MDSDNVPPTLPLPLPDDFPPAGAGPLEAAPPSGESQPPPPRWPVLPWLSIWTAPRGTIRAILDADPTRHVLLLAALAGITQSLGQASNRNTGDTLPIWAIFLLALVLGPLGGIIGLYIGGAIFRWTGSLFGGQATSQEVRAATAWSTVPVVVALVLWAPLLGLYGAEMFTSNAPRMASNPVPLYLLGWLQTVLGTWSLFLVIKTVAEAHRFSAWKAMAALALPAIVLVILFAGCAILIGLAGGGL